MKLSFFFASWRRTSHGKGRRRQPRFRPALECLEARSLPSIQPLSVAAGTSITANGPSSMGDYGQIFGIGRSIPDYSHDVSADGRYVVFESTASNLVAGQNTGGQATQVFLRDRIAGTTTLIGTVDSVIFNGYSAIISADGSVVAFGSSIYVVSSGAVMPVPSGGGALQSISADGNVIAYDEVGPIIIRNGHQINPDVAILRLYNRQTGTSTVVPDPTGGSQDVLADATLSADGQFVAYVANSEAAPQNFQVYLYDSQTGSNINVSQPANGSAATNNPAMISANGDYVVYTSTPTNPVAGQMQNVLLYSRLTNTTTLVSHAAGSTVNMSNGPSDLALISADGAYVYYESSASNLVAGQSGGGIINVYQYNVQTGANVLISHAVGSPTTAASGSSFPTTISADGRFVTYRSDAMNLVAGQVNASIFDNAFLYDQSTGSTTLVNGFLGSMAVTGNNGLQLYDLAISADGSTVVFTSNDSDLVRGDDNGFNDVFAFVGPNAGGFQIPVLASGSYAYNPESSPWTFNKSAGLTTNGSVFTSGNPGAPVGTQVAFLQGKGNITQSLPFLAGTYDITFSAAQRANLQASAQTFDVMVDGSVVGTFNNFTGKSYTTLTTSSFTVSAGSNTITLQGTDLNGGDNTVFLGQATINELPASLADSGFESPALARGTFQRHPTSGSPWTFSTSSGLASNGSAFTSGNPNASQGSQVAYLQAVSTISQSVTFAAGIYTISFLAAQRANFQASSQTLQVLVDGLVVGTFNTLVGTSYTPLSTSPFEVSAGSHTIAFQGTDLHQGDNTIFIDQVAVAPASLQIPTLGYGSFQYNPAGSSWTFSGSAGLAAVGSAFTSGNPSPPEGSQVAFLQGRGSAAENVLVPAGMYTISFSAAQRANVQASAQTFEVKVDGSVVDTVDNLTGTGFTNLTAPGYVSLTTSSITLAAGSHTITFLGTDVNGGDNTVFINKVTLNPLPTTTLPSWTANFPGYSQSISSGASPLTTFSASGTLPPGLTLSTSGVLSGTPTSPGTYYFTVTATDSPQTHIFTALDDPGATPGETYPKGVSGSNVVGFYFDSSNGVHGFLYNGSTYTTLEDPNATPGNTIARGISGSNIVGDYSNSTGDHGFLYNGSTWTTLDDPSALPGKTAAFGISGSNIVGDYTDSTGVHGFLYNGSTWTTLDDPSAIQAAGGTMATGISGSNIVGYYYDSNEGAHGFLYNGSTWTTLEDPSAAQGVTYVQGISGNNVVGYYQDSSDGSHGFLYNGSTWTTLDNPSTAPGSSQDYQAFGISGSSIVGFFKTSDSSIGNHGLLTTLSSASASQSYTITINPPVSITTTTLPNGTVNSANYDKPIAATGGTGSLTFSATGTLPPGLTLSTSGVLSGTPSSAGTYQFTVTASDSAHALIFTALNDPSATPGQTYPQGISGSNIVGHYYDSNGGVHGFLYNGSTWTTLDDPNATQANATQPGGTFAQGISGSNIVGYYYDSNLGIHGFLYNGSTYITLDDPGATPGNTYAEAISGSNIVGNYHSSSTGDHGFLYNGSTWTTLDDPNATQPAGTFAQGISGTNIVGSYYNTTGVHGFLYNGSTYITLDDPSAAPWYTWAYGISGNNIVGDYKDSSGEYHGFLYNGSTYTTLDNPSTTPRNLDAFAISGSNIVGFYGIGSTETYGFLATLSSASASQSYTITINPPVSITTTTLPNGTVNSANYAEPIAATGGTGSLTFSATGTLPPGLTLSTGGVLSGTPTSTGTYHFTVTATDSVHATAAQSYTLTINPPP